MDVRVAEEGERGRFKPQNAQELKVRYSGRGRFKSRSTEKLQSRILQVAQIVSIVSRFNIVKEECPKNTEFQTQGIRKGSKGPNSESFQITFAQFCYIGSASV